MRNAFGMWLDGSNAGMSGPVFWYKRASDFTVR